MGKATKWFMGVFGLRKPEPAPWNRTEPASTPSRWKERTKRWGFVKSYRETGRGVTNASYPQEKDHSSTSSCSASHVDSDRHKLSVAVGRRLQATSADADVAASKIQSAFRGYLARKALRALKALVKIQALVRGYIERKRTAEWLQRMQAMLRAQERARAERFVLLGLSDYCRNPPSEQAFRARAAKYDRSLMSKGAPSKSRSFDDERNDKILEVDRCSTTRRWNHPPHDDRHFYSQTLSYGEDEYYYAVENKRSPFTPTKSDGARSLGSGYLDNPSYMSKTESSRAKSRSISAPRQRGKRYSMQGRSNSVNRGSLDKGYPGSGRLDTYGLPIGQRY